MLFKPPLPIYGTQIINTSLKSRISAKGLGFPNTPSCSSSVESLNVSNVMQCVNEYLSGSIQTTYNIYALSTAGVCTLSCPNYFVSTRPIFFSTFGKPSPIEISFDFNGKEIYNQYTLQKSLTM